MKEIGVKELRRILEIATNEFKEQPSRLYSGHFEVSHGEKMAMAYLLAVSSVLELGITLEDIDVHEDQR